MSETFEEWLNDYDGDLGAFFSIEDAARHAWSHQQKKLNKANMQIRILTVERDKFRDCLVGSRCQVDNLRKEQDSLESRIEKLREGLHSSRKCHEYPKNMKCPACRTLEQDDKLTRANESENPTYHRKSCLTVNNKARGE